MNGTQSPREAAEVALVSRQPIYNRDRKLFAYELLYRNQFDTSESSDGDISTAEVLRNTLSEIGLDRIVGSHLAFVNLTRSFIVGDYCSALPNDRVVLEVLEDIAPDADVIRSLSKLSAEGYKIALDDFSYSEEKRPLLELAHFVKVDLRMFTGPEIVEQVRHLKPFKAKLLAEKVETHEEFEAAQQCGFDYFQGFFLCQPRTMRVNRMPMNRIFTLRLIVRLREEELSTAELGSLIQQDIAVSYNLLRYVNSAFVSLVQPVESVPHAVQMVGRQQIRAWASLLLLSTFGEKPRELIVTVMVRGKMAELLARALKVSSVDSYFTVGMFSVLDALLDLPMAEAIDLLPFSDAVKGALLRQEGAMGSVLRAVQAYEVGNWRGAKCEDLSFGVIRDSYLEAVSFAWELTRRHA